MILDSLKKKILIVGLGISGMSLASALNKTLCKIQCWDDDKNKREIAKKKKIKNL